MTRVLIVDDNPDDLQSLVTLARAAGYTALTAPGGDAALAMLRADPGIAAVILDLVMPDRDGMGVLETMRRERLAQPVIVAGTTAAPESVDTALRAGAVDFFVKPTTRQRLAVSLRNALRLDALGAALRTETGRRAGTLKLNDIVAGSPAMDRVVTLCGKAARNVIPVLVEGEAGTGKELVARVIHGLGDRAGKPFVSVNCALMGGEAGDAGLFGAGRNGVDRAGLITAAHNGTLYLDEIDALPPEAQARLLRLLETGELPSAGARPERVNVRVIAASRRRLLNLARSGDFREDLFYRLNVLPIYLPPLRDRPEDIAALADRFLARAQFELGKNVDGVSAEALALLRSFAWPGNVRQLESVLYRAVTLAESGLLTPVDLPQLLAETAGRDAAMAATATLNTASAPVHIDLALPRPKPPASRERQQDRFVTEGDEVTPLATIEREIIVFAIGKYEGHMSRIARALGIGRSTLYRKLREYGLDGEIQSDAA